MIRAALNSIAGKGNARFRCLGIWTGVSSAALLMEGGYVGTIRNERVQVQDSPSTRHFLNSGRMHCTL